MGQTVPKQYLDLNGAPILEVTLQRLLRLQPRQLCLVVSSDDEQWTNMACAKECLTSTGGASRAESVLSGLISLELAPNDMVLIHDAVRPLFRETDVLRLIQEVGDSEHGGLLATPVIDTLKESDALLSVVSTPDRNRLWQAQTPQIFRAGLLQQALETAAKNGTTVTDEASAMEAMGYQPRLVEGSRNNIKITTQEDLALARYLLSLEPGGGSCA